MKKLFLILIPFFLSACSLWEKEIPLEEQPDVFVIDAGSGFEILYDSGATESAKSVFTKGKIVINGSYFGMSGSSYIPAGLFAENGKILTPLRTDDPNLSHVVLVHSGSEGTWIYSNERMSLGALADDDIRNSLFAFQAGPLVIAGGVTQTFTGSFSMNQYPRTLLGILPNGKAFFFVFPHPKTLAEVAEIIGNDPDFSDTKMTVINLDGGPSSAYYDGTLRFNENAKLPIFIIINQ